MKQKLCVVCLQHFTPINGMQKYCCGDCKKIGDKKSNAKEKPQKKKKTVRDIAKEAKEHGMTYGQYVAKMGL